MKKYQKISVAITLLPVMIVPIIFQNFKIGFALLMFQLALFVWFTLELKRSVK